MSNSPQDNLAEEGRPKHFPQGTMLPTSNSSFGSSELAPPANRPYGTYQPGTAANGASASLPQQQRFASVYQTHGAHDNQIQSLVGQIQSEIQSGSEHDQEENDDDYDSIHTIDAGHSDYLNTINLEEFQNHHFANSPGSTSSGEGSDRDFRQYSEQHGKTTSQGGMTPLARKSTWQLQIRARSLKGHVSGVRNRIPQVEDEAVGFLNAFVDNPDVAEYEILHELGKGNMGIVYEARQSSLNRELAIKSLNPKQGSARYEQEMFVSEAVVTANLVHPNIVPIHDLGRTDDGKLFYSMKKVTGTSWDKILREQPLEENLDIFLKVCDAVAYAHSRGVINRDLKPENVVVGSYGEVVVLDWGLAITNEKFPKQESILLDYRGGAGTPVYMAPELVSDDVGMVGNHTDIYLLGAILFEILEGFPPHLLRQFWAMDDPNEQFASIVTAAMTNQIERHVTRPGELMDIAFQAMSTDVQARYQSVEEMQEAIRQYRITGHAEEFYLAAKESGDQAGYDNYQSAVALFSEALRKWPGNQRAQAGDRLARKGFAQLALKKGDFDLGLHIIEGYETPDFADIRKGLKRSRGRRTVIKRTWTALALGIVLLAGITLMVSKDAIAAREEANKAEADVARARSELQEVEEKVADANRKIDIAEEQTQAALMAQQAAEVAKRQAEEDIVRVAAEKEKAERDKLQADQAKMVAELASAEALKKSAEAEQKLTEANASLLKAERDSEAAMKAAQQAQQAKLVAEMQKMEAEAVLEAARDAKQKAEAELLSTEWKAFDLQVNLNLKLGKYEEALSEIEKALEKATLKSGDFGYNPLFVRRRSTILRKQQELKSLRSEHSRKLEGDVKSVVIGRKGKVVAYSTAFKVELLVANEAEPAPGVPTLSGMRSYSFSNVPALSQLTISDDERFVVASGRNYKRLWSIKEGVPVDYTLIDQFQHDDLPEAKTSYRAARFNPEGTHLFLFTSEERPHLEIYDLTGTSPVGLVRASVYGTAPDSFGIEDFFVLPTTSADAGERITQLVYLGIRGGASHCKVLTLTWNQGLPELDQAISRKPLGQSRSDEERSLRMEQILVSPDFQRMIVRLGDKAIRVYERNAEPGEFPFRATDNIQPIFTDNTITSLGLSSDGRRLLAGIRDGYIEIWDWNSNTQNYVASEANAEGFWQGHRLGGLSENPLASVFLDGSTEVVMVAGLVHSNDPASGSSLLRWNLSDYSRYRDLIHELAVNMDKIGMIPFIQQGSTPLTSNRLQPFFQNFNFEQRKLAQSTSRLEQGRADWLERAQPEIPFASLELVAQNEAVEADEAKVTRRWLVSRSVESARFSLDGLRILAAADDRAAHVYARDKATIMFTGGRRSRFYEPRRNVFEEGHIPEISDLVFLPPLGHRLLTKDFFGSVSVWDASDDEDGFAREVSRILTTDFGLAASPDGKWVVASARDVEESVDGERSQPKFVARIWDATDFEKTPNPDPIRTFAGQHDRLITSIAVSPDSQTLATADRRGRIVVWDLMTAQMIASTSGAHGNDQVSGIAFLNEAELISTGFDGTIQRWLMQADQLTKAEERFQYSRGGDLDDYIISLALAPDRKHFATLSVKTGQLRQVPDQNTFVKGQSLVRMTVWSVDKNALTAEQAETHLDLFSREWPESTSVFEQGIAWSGKGDKLAHLYPTEISGSIGSELLIYNTQTWKPSQKYHPKGLTGIAAKIAFTPNTEGEEFLATFDGRIAHLWSLSEEKHLAEFRSHETVFGAAFSADRKLVATVSDSLRVFMGNELSDRFGSTIFRKTDAHRGRVEEIRFSQKPGSYNFATLGGDRTLKLWDWNWSPTASIVPPVDPAVTLDLSPSERHLNMQMDETLQWKSSLEWSPSENLIAATFGGELFLFRRVNEHYQRLNFDLPEGWNVKFNCSSISSDESMLCAGGVRVLEDERTAVSVGIVWKFNEAGEPVLEAKLEGDHSASTNSNRQAGVTAIQFYSVEGGFWNILTGGTDGRLLQWDWDPRLDDEEPLPSAQMFVDHKLPDNSNPHGSSTVNSIDISPTRDIITAGADGNVVFIPGT